MPRLVLEVFLAMSVIMTAGWLYQRAANNAGWSDVFWTFGTGLCCAAAALFSGAGAGWRHVFVAAVMLLWSLRLGLHVALRVASSPEDIRYATLRKNAPRHFQAKIFALLIVQAPVTALLSIAVIFAARQPVLHLRLLDLIGGLVMLTAIAGEALADWQMNRFRAANTGQNRVCDQGLWAISRHPNYLFEFIGWLAYPIIGISAQHPWSLFSLLAPAIMYLVLRYATGVPALEAAMLQRKGSPYAQYQAKTGMIFPKL